MKRSFTRTQLAILAHLGHLARGGYLEGHVPALRDLHGAGVAAATSALADDGLVTVVYPRVWLTSSGRTLAGV